MRFRLPQKDFLRLFSIAEKTACDEKTPIPILSKVRIDAHPNGDILFDAHGGDATIRLLAKGDVLQHGSIAAPRMLAERLRYMPEGLLEIGTTEGAQIELSHTTEKRRFRVFGIPTHDWPTTLKRPDGEEQKVSVAVLRLLIESVEKCVGTDESKHATNSLMLMFRETHGGAQIRAVGIDGYRMATMRRDAPVRGPHDLLIRRGNLRTLKAMLDMATAAEIPDVTLIPGQGKLAVEVAGASYVCRLTDERFPPYEQAVPGAWVRRFKLPRVKFLDAIKGALLVEKTTIRLQFMEDGKIGVTANNVESGDVADNVEVAEMKIDKGVAPAFKVALNAHQLKDAVESVSEEDVFLCPTDYTGITLIAPASETAAVPLDASHVVVLMPMRG